MAMASEESFPSLRDLASSDSKLRRLATENLFAYIASPNRASPLSQTQFLQAWRALFVAMLMHDSKNQISVQKLISNLAEQFQVVAERDSSANAEAEGELHDFTSAFWETICREWANVDRLRIDKVLLLVRMAIRRLFQICLDPGIDPKQQKMKAQIETFEAWPLSPRERKVPDGVRYHVLDVWVDELLNCKQLELQKKRAVEEGEGATQEEEDDLIADPELELRVGLLMQPVQKISKDALNKPVRIRAKDTLADAEEKLKVPRSS